MSSTKQAAQDLRDRCHRMYEAAVQDTESDIEFIDSMFTLEKKPLPLRLREDFCGTAKLVCDWVTSDNRRTAIGVDMDADTLAAAKRLNTSHLSAAQQERLDLVQEDVRKAPGSDLDVIVGFNFSFCVFHHRKDLLAWMKNALAALHTDGALMLDITGGSEYTIESKEPRTYGNFKYYWEQCTYNPITGQALRYIHFKPKGEPKIKRAFTYDWRLWHLPELVDALEDAGFARVEVYWEGATEDGDGDGHFVCTAEAEQELSWIAYIVAWKS